MRETMQPLVDTLRRITNASYTDSFHDETFWTDEQLLAYLDKHRELVRGSYLTAMPYMLNGSENRRSQAVSLAEQYELELEAIVIRTTDGELVETGYTFRHEAGMLWIDFSSDPPDEQLLIDFFRYDIYAAASDVWGEKASQRHDYVQTSAGGHKFRFNDDYEHCVQRSSYYRSLVMRSFRVTRGGFLATTRRPRR